MAIETCRFSKLRNMEVYKIAKDFRGVIMKHGATAMGIDTFFPELTVIENDITALVLSIKKSYYTAEIKAADDKRDNTFITTRNKVEADLTHFDPLRKQSSYRVSLVFNEYGDVHKKGYLEETGFIDNLIDELRTNYSNDINVLGLMNEINQLEIDNGIFEDLISARLDQIKTKPKGSMKELRKRYYDCYCKIVARVEALININGITNYQDFVDDLNARIRHYNNVIAQREGKNKKK